MNKKGFINIIIIGVVVVIIAAAGYFALTRKTAEAPATTQEAEDLATKDWKTYTWGSFQFQYPSNWKVEDEYYTTPASYTDKVAVIVSPPDQDLKNEFITIGGRQVNCDLITSVDSYCVEILNIPIHTLSKNSKIIQIFELMVKKTREANNF